MELSTEDQLRLNVLLAHEVDAIRIDEPAMTVHALAASGDEARIALNPNCRAEQYLKRVRELLSTHALGSPGGYPVFLQRWTRMGQHREGQLDKLLLLGEPEAVVAVAGAPSLTPELARRVWWIMPESDVARRMLERESVSNSDFGRMIAAHLVDHLAFETEPLTVVQTIRLVLAPGLISDATRERLWARATQRNLYHRLGFLEAVPDNLPQPLPAHAALAAHRERLAGFTTSGNPVAGLLARALDPPGQTFLAVSAELLGHPVDKYTVAALFNVIGSYFSAARGALPQNQAVDALLESPEVLLAALSAAGELLEVVPALRPQILALLALAHVDESLVTPVLSRTTAGGTLLRRKLERETALILRQYSALRHSSSG